MGRRQHAHAAQLMALGDGRWRLAGDLTLSAVSALATKRLEPGEQQQVMLDLAGVGKPSSAGVALLLEWQAQLRADGATLVLHNVPLAMQRLAALANVDALLGLGEQPDPAAGAADVGVRA
ncbi:STAS domain-containing protein [uncultured Thiohalocapsa sp.]|uniref:STAS domain-containing protein n=1 Tax=uncultured Thiohalocapsa sp. TaxID=768990 RepID=UPI0025FA69E4|nr:STAS domain-containing protein [uncultured Thiohalocapsa sp.]